MFATVVRRRSVIQRMHMFMLMHVFHVMHFFMRFVMGIADESNIAVMTGIRQNRCHGLQRQRHSQEAGEEET